MSDKTAPKHDIFTCPACGATYQVGALGVDTGWYGCDRCRARWTDEKIVLANGEEYSWA